MRLLITLSFSLLAVPTYAGPISGTLEQATQISQDQISVRIASVETAFGGGCAIYFGHTPKISSNGYHVWVSARHVVPQGQWSRIVYGNEKFPVRQYVHLPIKQLPDIPDIVLLLTDEGPDLEPLEIGVPDFGDEIVVYCSKGILRGTFASGRDGFMDNSGSPISSGYSGCGVFSNGKLIGVVSGHDFDNPYNVKLGSIQELKSNLSELFESSSLEVSDETRVVEFYFTRSCPACIQMQPVITKLIQSGVEVKPCDANQFPSITTVPTTIIREGSREVDRIVGYATEEEIRKLLNTIPMEDHWTPQQEVSLIIDQLDLQPGEVLADPGCGDARILIEAAKRGHQTVGIEIDPEIADLAWLRVREAGLEDRVTIIIGDATQVDWEADVAYVYLFGDTLQALKPKLIQLNRFATRYHQVPGLPMYQKGNLWFWYKTQQRTEPVAYWRGQAYRPSTFSPCGRSGCEMCNSILAQWGWQ